MDEDFSSLYGQSPYECPPLPPGELNMTMFGVHLTRLISLIEDIRGLFELYMFIVSWRNPFVTFASLILFVYSSCRFDSEYIGSIPLSLLMLWMLYLAVARWRGRLRRRLLGKEDEEHLKVSFEP